MSLTTSDAPTVERGLLADILHDATTAMRRAISCPTYAQLIDEIETGILLLDVLRRRVTTAEALVDITQRIGL